MAQLSPAAYLEGRVLLFRIPLAMMLRTPTKGEEPPRLLVNMKFGVFTLGIISHAQKEKATRQRRRPLLQGRIVPTEVKSRQNFLAKSYEAKIGGVKKFLGNKQLYFQRVMKIVNYAGAVF